MRCASVFSWMLLALAATGCAHRGGGCGHGGAGAPGSDALEIVLRDPSQIDASQVEPLPRVDQVLAYPPAPGNYHALSAGAAQCMAASNSGLGNLFDGERRALAANEEAAGICSHQDNSLTYDVLRTAALEARNKSAGDALDDYYQLAQNERRMDFIARGLVEARQANEGVERLRNQGLKLPAEDDVFVRRETELRNQHVQVESGIIQLNAHLWQMIGLVPIPPQERIWPTADLSPVVTPMDVEAEVQLGLGMRPELGMLRRLRARLDEDSLGSARAALSQLSPLLGLAPQEEECKGVFGLLGKLRKLRQAREELPERRRQLAQYSQQREREVEVEIRCAADTVALRLRQIALAKEALVELRGRLPDIETRRTTGGATFADVAATRLAVIQAESDLMDKVVAWKIAVVRLKQSQGLLIAECCP